MNIEYKFRWREFWSQLFVFRISGEGEAGGGGLTYSLKLIDPSSLPSNYRNSGIVERGERGHTIWMIRCMASYRHKIT